MIGFSTLTHLEAKLSVINFKHSCYAIHYNGGSIFSSPTQTGTVKLFQIYTLVTRTVTQTSLTYFSSSLEC